MIQAQYPNVDITNEGEADFVIEYEPALQPSQTAEYAKTAVLCVLVFFGAAFTIMAFNNAARSLSNRKSTVCSAAKGKIIF